MSQTLRSWLEPLDGVLSREARIGLLSPDEVLGLSSLEVREPDQLHEGAGHLELASPALHPWLAPLVAHLLGWSVEDLKQVVRFQATRDGLSGPAAVLEKLSATTSELLQTPAWVMVRRVLVVPPELRPDRRGDLNTLYGRILNRNTRLRRFRDMGAASEILRNEERLLQDSVEALFDNERRAREPDEAPRVLRSLGAMTLDALKRDPAAHVELRGMGFVLLSAP